MAEIDWEDAMTDGESFDETVTDPLVEQPDPDALDVHDAPEGYLERDDEFADDDPVDVVSEHGDAQRALEAIDDNRDEFDDGESVVDEHDDWE